MHLVIAGNYQQYRDYLAERQSVNKSKWRYIASEHDLRGYREASVHFVGTYYSRKDLSDLRDLVSASGYTEVDDFR